MQRKETPEKIFFKNQTAGGEWLKPPKAFFFKRQISPMMQTNLRVNLDVFHW